jgi:hypothetical protein
MILRTDTIYQEDLSSQKVMRFSIAPPGSKKCFKRHKIKTNVVSIDRL